MNTPQQAGAAGQRDRVARHARAGPESVLSSIPQQPSPEAELSLPPGQPAPALPLPPGEPAPAFQLPPGQPAQTLSPPPGQPAQAQPPPGQAHPPPGQAQPPLGQPQPAPGQPQPVPGQSHPLPGQARLPLGQPAEPEPRGARIIRSWRYLLPALAGGTVATAIPAARALGWPAGVRTGAGPWLAAAAAILGTALSQMITDIYRARQRTRRTEIEQRGADAIATALAQLINAAHSQAQNLSGAKEMEESARVRDSAREVTVDLVAAITALARRPGPAGPAGSQERPES
jgi:hypothetical protein